MQENQQLSFPVPKTGKKKQLQELVDTFQADLSVEAANITLFLFHYQELYACLGELMASDSPALRNKTQALSERTKRLTEAFSDPVKLQAGLEELGIGVTNLAQHILEELPET